MPAIILFIGFANQYENSFLERKMYGIRKCSNDHSSIKLFCNGVLQTWTRKSGYELHGFAVADIFLLHESVPGQQQPSLSVKTDERLPSLTLKILDVLSFIEHQIIPPFPFERK